jgi:TolB protein
MRKVICSVVLSLVVFSSFAAEERGTLEREFDPMGFLKPVPVSISGFSGEVDSVLRNDLLFMGVVNVPLDQAKYLVSGSNGGRVEGGVTDKVTKHPVMPRKAYTGGTLRSQTHALADDIAQALTQLPGIAQRKITFKTHTGPGAKEIYISDYDGHNAKPVTQDRVNVAAPSWGEKNILYYSSYKLGNAAIFSHNLPTGQRKAIARYGGSSISPAASPDGSKLAMILSKGGSPDLYVSDPDGGNLRQLTTTREAESSPCWSPDGRTICYTSRERGGRPSLFKVSASGGKATPIPTPGAPTPSEPDWSPNGKWIAFTSLIGGTFRIFITPPDGGRVYEVAEGEDPSWAPNSRALIFCKGPDGGKRLSLLDVPTKQTKDVPRVLESNSQPGWAR